MEALKWGLSKPLADNSCTILCNYELLWAFGPFCKGNFRRAMTTLVDNRGKLWTTTLRLTPPFESPHFFTFPRFRSWGRFVEVFSSIFVAFVSFDFYRAKLKVTDLR